MTEATSATPHGPGDGSAGRALDPMVRRVFEAAGIAVATLDAEGHVVSATTEFARRLHRGLDEIVGRHLVGLWPERHRAELTATLVSLVEGSAEVAGVVVDVEGENDGDERAEGTSEPRERVTFGRLTDSSGRTGGMVCTITGHEVETVDSDTSASCASASGPAAPTPARSDRRRSAAAAGTTQPIAAEVAHLLVGGPSGVEPLLVSALRRSARVGTPIALLRCELSGLDPSTRLPHAVDARISEYSNRLFERLRSTDHVIRTSDTGFLVVAQDLGDEQDAAGVAYRLLAAAVEPITVEDRTMTLGMTIGVVIADAGASPTNMVDASNAALEAALDDGGGGFRLIDLRSGMAA